MRKAILGTVAALGLTAPAFAEEGLSYSYVELGYINTETDFDEGDGLNLFGSYQVAELAHIFTSYSDQDFDSNVRTEFMQIGLGLNFTIAENLDVVPRLSYVEVQTEVPPFGTFDDDGFALGFGLRAQLLDERLELGAGFQYLELDQGGDDTSINAGARFYLTDKIAAAVDILENDGDTTYIIGGRYDFRGR
jgi:hypothetical protein